MSPHDEAVQVRDKGRAPHPRERAERDVATQGPVPVTERFRG